MKIKMIIHVTFLVFFLKQACFGQSNWNQRNSMLDYGRHVAVSFTIGNKAYVGLGEIWDETEPADFWEYNSVTNHWTRKNDFPGGGRYSACSFSLNGKGYVCMGLDENGQIKHDLWEYNPLYDFWEQKQDFPGISRYGATSFVIGDSVFICSGSQGGSNNYLNDLWVYKPGTDSWNRKQDFPGEGRSHATSFSLDGYGFVGTGLYNFYTPSKDFWKYNPLSNSWVRISDVPGQPRLGCVSFVVDNEAYIGLGYDQTVDYNTFYKYIYDINQWQPIPIEDNIEPRRGSTSFTIENIGYFCTGEGDYGLFSDLWAFSSSPWTSNKNLYIESQFSIFPNPGNETLNLVSSENLKGKFISFYNLFGQECIRKQISEKVFQIDVSELPCGTYFLKIYNSQMDMPIKFVKIR